MKGGKQKRAFIPSFLGRRQIEAAGKGHGIGFPENVSFLLSLWWKAKIPKILSYSGKSLVTI